MQHDRPSRELANADPQADRKVGCCRRQEGPSRGGLAPDDDLPPEYWESILRDVPADDMRSKPGVRMRRLVDIPQHLLRVSCRRCGRTVEIQKADAARLYGPDAIWRDVGQRLLDNTCTQRTGRHEEDGCWPVFE